MFSENPSAPPKANADNAIAPLWNATYCFLQPQPGIDAIDPSSYTVPDGNGQATTAREAGDDVGSDARPAADRGHSQEHVNR
jgi:hypothetical protein